MIFSQKLKTSINQKVKNKKKTFAIEGMANVLQAFEQISMTPSKIMCEPHHQQNAQRNRWGIFVQLCSNYVGVSVQTANVFRQNFDIFICHFLRDVTHHAFISLPRLPSRNFSN